MYSPFLGRYDAVLYSMDETNTKKSSLLIINYLSTKNSHRHYANDVMKTQTVHPFFCLAAFCVEYEQYLSLMATTSYVPSSDVLIVLV